MASVPSHLTGGSREPQADPASLERTWRGLALRLVGQRNFALWLDYFVPLFSAVTLLFAVVLLATRTLGGPSFYVMAAFPVVLVLLVAGIWLYLRKRFDRTIDGLVQLDINCRLHNRLTCASTGLGPWPKVPARLRLMENWRWQRILPPILCSLGLLWAAHAIKVTTPDAFRPKPKQQPMAWTQTESWLETLKTEDLVQEEALDDFAAKMEDLKKQDSQEWFSHGSLEAGDSLKANMEKGMLDLQNYLKQAQDLLESAREAEGQMGEATMEKVDAQFKEAMQGLQNGSMPLNQELMNQMKSVDPKAMSQMSKQDYEKMMERMQNGQQSLAECLGNGEGQGEGMAGMKSGQGKGRKSRHTVEGEEGMDGEGGFGKGGVNRGRGDAPLTFEDAESQLGTNNLETISSQDFERAMPSDLVGMSQTTPEVDETQMSGPQGGGSLMSTGKGGEAVWRDTLTPEEREFLGRVYQ